MGDDRSEARNALLGALGAYGRLYPSMPRRVDAILASDSPHVQAMLQGLKASAGRRAADLGTRAIKAYGLSPAEARVATHIADGGSVETYAAQAGVSRGTVRSQLKSVFAKTGVHRQAELALKLATL